MTIFRPIITFYVITIVSGGLCYPKLPGLSNEKKNVIFNHKKKKVSQHCITLLLNKLVI